MRYNAKLYIHTHILRFMLKAVVSYLDKYIDHLLSLHLPNINLPNIKYTFIAFVKQICLPNIILEIHLLWMICAWPI